VGVIEAKAEGATLSGVAEQSTAYALAAAGRLPRVTEPLPFVYKSTGVETYFRDLRDPDSRSRPLYAFHRPETMADWACRSGTWRCQGWQSTTSGDTFLTQDPNPGGMHAQAHSRAPSLHPHRSL
jgi:hypothetical protein